MRASQMKSMLVPQYKVRIYMTYTNVLTHCRLACIQASPRLACIHTCVQDIHFL